MGAFRFQLIRFNPIGRELQNPAVLCDQNAQVSNYSDLTQSVGERENFQMSPIEGFQLFRFNPIGREHSIKATPLKAEFRFQLIRFNPIGRDATISEFRTIVTFGFPINPI